MSGGQVIDVVLAPAFAAINLAYIALLVGAFCQSLNRIRVLLVLAALFFVAYGALEGIQSMVVWNLVIGGLNLQRLIAGLWSDAQIHLTAEQETLRRRFFSECTPTEFLWFWKLGEDVLCVDELLVEAGSVPDRLYLLVRGTVHIQRDGAVLLALGTGAVIGQLESARFLRPSADWQGVGAVRLRSWRLADLTKPDLHPKVFRLLDRNSNVLVGAAV